MIIRSNLLEFSLLIELPDIYLADKEKIEELVDIYTKRWVRLSSDKTAKSLRIRETSWIDYVTSELLNDYKWLRWARVANEMNTDSESIIAILEPKAWHTFDGERPWPREVEIA